MNNTDKISLDEVEKLNIQPLESIESKNDPKVNLHRFVALMLICFAGFGNKRSDFENLSIFL
jgi:hypothetical protein